MADANWSANNAATRIQFLNRITYTPSLPFPYNQTNSQTTDSTVISSLEIRPNSTLLRGILFTLDDPFQGYNSLNESSEVTQGLFGLNRIGVTTPGSIGNTIQLINNSAAGVGSPGSIMVHSRTDHIPYWTASKGGLNTSTQGQVNWISTDGILSKNNDISGSLVKGAHLALNGMRMETLNKTVTYWDGEEYSYSGNLIWSTSTRAGDVLGTVSFQGSLDGVTDACLLNGGVDGILIRAYAKNNWQGEQTSTTTNVTYTNNQSALRIEITTATTIGPLDFSGGMSQRYKTLFEIDAFTATFSTDVIPSQDLAYDLGSPDKQWRSLYVGTGTIYIGGVPITVNTLTNTLVVGTSSYAASTTTNLATESYVIDYVAQHGGGGASGLPNITIPASTGTNYKGLQVSYGMIYDNSQFNELNVNKIVINKPAITSVEIDPTGEQDFFKVSGVGSSDVLAMFVLYGNTNGAKSLSTLTTFAEVIIDNVILDGGVEGSYNTVDEMKSAFYSNYSTISAAAGGLNADFTFYNNPTPVNTGTTTVQEGSGAAFSIVSPGDGFAYVDPPTVWLGSEGTNYLVGHKIKILGTDLGGATPANDAIITITGVGVGGSITTATIAGTGGDVGGGTYNAVTGTNYQVGSGFDVANIFFTNTGTYDYLNLHSAGTNYVVGDILTLLGSGIVNGSSPTNDITITITAVDGGGVATTWTASGIFPRQWPTNSIGDGGNDQYDGANYINSSFASQINYNQGNTVADGIAAFGTGSSYTFVYNTGTFGLFVTGNASTYIETSGNSGADGDSTTESGNLYGPSTAAETFDNAVTHLNIVGDPYAGPIVSFTRPDNSDETIDILIPDDGEGAGVAIARDSNGNGIFNPYREGSWDSDVSPGGTLWNIDGWTDLSDVESRTYTPLYEAFGFGGLGNKIVGTECVMYLPDNGKYYTVKFDSWTQGGNGGGFTYTRRELDLANLQEGIRFSDGTRLKSAEGVGRVKLRSPGNRRIEEVYGYKAVSLSQVVTTNLTTVASRSDSSTNLIWIDSTATTIDDIISNPQNYNNAYNFEFSLDNNIWYEWTQSTSFSGNERGYSIATTVTYLQGDTVYFRYKTGGEPVVWWNKADLPGGSGNFRGAVIDYHAYTGESTIIGTIHIVNDDGEEHISHQEVQSGSTDGENDDLWYVTSEGQIKYRRIDGEGKTLKVQWSARVFYGSELYD